MNPTSSPPRSRSTFKTVLIAFAVLFGLTVIGGAAYFMWANRDINPTVLTTPELETAEQKLALAQAEPAERAEPEYRPGEKTITLTEHEINGLINHHTQLGETLKIELASDAIHARLQTTLDADFPVMGGRTVKGRARVLTKSIDGRPALILDDLTLYGVSIPNAWMADLKGQNLLANIDAELGEGGLAKGIKNLSVQNGKLVLELND